MITTRTWFSRAEEPESRVVHSEDPHRPVSPFLVQNWACRNSFRSTFLSSANFLSVPEVWDTSGDITQATLVWDEARFSFYFWVELYTFLVQFLEYLRNLSLYFLFEDFLSDVATCRTGTTINHSVAENAREIFPNPRKCEETNCSPVLPTGLMYSQKLDES